MRKPFDISELPAMYKNNFYEKFFTPAIHFNTCRPAESSNYDF